MLDYFYGLTNLGTGIIRTKWDYPAATTTGIGYGFLSNSGANSFSTQLEATNLSEFSLFFTYEKRQSSFNNKGIVLLQTMVSGVRGFEFGLDAANFAYLRTNSDCYTFDEINLAGKNTVCLQKGGNSFSLSHYSIPSSGFINSQTVYVNPSINLSGSQYFFAGPQQASGTNRFYGTVDQLLLLSKKIGLDDSITIYSGFSALDITQDGAASYRVDSDEWFLPTPTINSGLQNHLRSYLTGVYQDYVIDEALAANSEFIGRITFSGTGGGYNTRNYYGQDTLSFCSRTGTLFQMGDPDFMASGTGLPYNFNVNLNFSRGPYDLVNTFFPREMYFTYDLSEIQPGLRYSNLMTLYITQSVVQGSNTGYFSGFEMNGVMAPNADLALLGTLSGNSQQIGNNAVFDSIQGSFFGSGVSGLPIYLNGSLVYPSGYTFQSGKINVLNYMETTADQIIYDQVSGVQPLSLSNSSSPTGNFWPKTSFVATGEYSFEPLKRITEESYYETHRFHPYHARNWQATEAALMYSEEDVNWS